MLMNGFQPSCEVTQPDHLFGRNGPGELLDQSIMQLCLGTNIQIMGERRSGKTSLLKCAIKVLQLSYPTIIPVYLNYREHHTVRGYTNAHRLLLAYIGAAINQVTFFMKESDDVIFSQFTTNHSINYEKLIDIPDYRIDGFLSQLIHQVNQKGFGIVLFLDEYEHLMRYTFEGREGAFFHLRDLSSMPPVGDALPKPLTYAIAGGVSWDKLCEMIGSPELNNIGAVFYLDPLDFLSFTKMWDQCLVDSSLDIVKLVEKSNISLETIFDLAGGWPFYGKVIGAHLCSSQYNETFFYDSLFQHFSVIWAKLTHLEQEVLKQSEQAQILYDDSVVRYLHRRGLLATDTDGLFVPCGQLWAKFIRQQLMAESPNLNKQVGASSPSDNNSKLTIIVEDIQELITEINETSLNINHEEMFRCSNQDVQTYKDLRDSANNAAQFSHFALSLYNLFFERTTGSVYSEKTQDKKSQESLQRSLERLPKDFRRKRTFIRVVDAVRHHFGKGHLTRLDSFNTSGNGMHIEDVLQKYLGSKAHPHAPQFLELQKGILEDAVQFLRQIKAYVEKQALTDNEKTDHL